MSTRTIQVHPSKTLPFDTNHTHIYQGVNGVNMAGGLTLYGAGDKLIAHYQEHAWDSWNVVPGTEEANNDLPPRDELGRFTKRD